MSLIHKTVRKSNALVEASYRLSVFEQRIILACLSQIGKGEQVTDQVLYRVSAAEIARAAKITPQTAYQRLREAASRLFERRVTLVTGPNGQGIKKDVQTRWIQTCTYIDTEACVEVRFGRDILPYLTELSKQFTKYRFGDIAEMNSSYAIRLYELLMQWEGTGKREVSTDWLRSIFQAEDKYPAIKDFKKNIILPAVNQINEHSPLNVEWDQRKTGRKVTHFVFTFQAKQAAIKIAKKPKPPVKGGALGIPKEEILKHQKPGEDALETAIRMKKEGWK